MTSRAQEHPSLTFVQTLYRCRELGSGALARLAGAATLQAVKQGLAGFPTSHEGQLVCQDTALVAKLVLHDLEATEHGFTSEPTEEGLATLAAVQAAVFGPAAASRPFTECVFLATLSQATLTLELVTAALLDALSPSNCLSLLSAASGCGHAPLAAAARRLALAAFPAAWRADPNGLLSMPEPLLVSLLSSDALRVPSELEVFHALCAWTEAGGEAAHAGLPARLARCVRLGTVTVPDIEVMDDHPLVRSNKLSLQLLATVYMGMVMGQPVDCPLGYRTSARRRTCQRAGAASSSSSSSSSEAASAAAEQAAARRDCGQQGCSHASVFEAAACALARRRGQREQAAAEQAAEACMRRVSVDGTAACAAATPVACSSAPRAAPASSGVHDAPTPTAGISTAAAAAGIQPTARVRLLGVGSRCGSRRSLFDLEGEAGAAQKAAAQLDDGSKSLAAALPPPLPHAAAAAAAPVAAPLGGVSLEMRLSPRRASIRALAAHAAAAAAAPHPAGWESRKRLRFD